MIMPDTYGGGMGDFIGKNNYPELTLNLKIVSLNSIYLYNVHGNCMMYLKPVRRLHEKNKPRALTRIFMEHKRCRLGV